MFLEVDEGGVTPAAVQIGHERGAVGREEDDVVAPYRDPASVAADHLEAGRCRRAQRTGQARLEADALPRHPGPGGPEQLQCLLIAPELDPDLVQDPIGMTLDGIDLILGERIVGRKPTLNRDQRIGDCGRPGRPTGPTASPASRHSPVSHRGHASIMTEPASDEQWEDYSVFTMTRDAIPSTMRAVVLLGHGDLDQLEYRVDVPVPSPAADEVLIEVAACGMNNTDINTRTGWYSKSVVGATGDQAIEGDVDGSWGGGMTFPRIQGADPAGRIVAVGSEVDPGRIGQRVICDAWLRDPGGDLTKAGYLGSERDGGYAEYTTVPSANAYAVRTDLTAVELASFPCSYATAEHMLERPKLRAGQWVVATGASGGVGGAVVQLARRRGAHTIAIASESKLETTASATGADHTLARQDPDLLDKIRQLTGGGADVLADVVAGEQFASLFEVIRRGGHYTTAGAIAGPIVPLDVRTLYLNDLTMHGCTVLEPAVFANLVRYIEDGEIQPIVAGTFPLRDLADAQRAFMAKTTVGSYVIDLDA